jgi:hypothetical protein
MRTLLIIAAVLGAVALPAAAIASRAPTRDERAALRKAVKSSDLVSRSIRKGRFDLVKPRIAENGNWARAGIAPNDTYTDPFNAPTGLFKHKGKGWKLVKYATSGVGCKKPRLPRAVRRDLKLKCG